MRVIARRAGRPVDVGRRHRVTRGSSSASSASTSRRRVRRHREVWTPAMLDRLWRDLNNLD